MDDLLFQSLAQLVVHRVVGLGHPRLTDPEGRCERFVETSPKETRPNRKVFSRQIEPLDAAINLGNHLLQGLTLYAMHQLYALHILGRQWARQV